MSVGGALGAVGRHGVATLWPTGTLPWATLAVNLTGAAALGALMTLVVERLPPGRYLRPFLGIGVLGSWTTVSTLMADTRQLWADGHAWVAGGYLAGTVLGGLAAAWAGVAAVRTLTGRGGIP